ncbi:Slp family lipoprotein [Geobacter sp. DSM 9736]|uniref:Slp family lipoprotein n=1 Tax=Geobacter sp. DSM 9736 TaxID=1277350 RepID=UPI000B5E91AC|nr:Slp family lipoprotein [Geobacter sp. DSM 9736]SNB47446.1 outer membrane lipoprotein [Geobacter sp. DSM 9736]
MTRIVSFAVLCIALSGCANVMSKQSMQLVDKSVSFEMVRTDPEAYKGKYILTGGTIAGIRNRTGESQLEVVQLPLDSSGRPEESYETRGRFIAVMDKFLDPLIFKQGRQVTIVGEVRGQQVRRLDQVDYAYPVLGVRELHLWQPEPERYAPYGYGYPYYRYDPWWPYWYNRPGPYRWW